MLKIFVSSATVLACLITLHGGRTDEWGGHYDHSTGEYHYHHGYPAHDHYDIDGDGTVDCPYNFEDNTIHKNPSSSETTNHDNTEHETKKPPSSPENDNKTETKLTFKDVLVMILGAVFVSFMVYYMIMAVCLIAVILLEPLVRKFSKKETRISESDGFQKVLSIVIYIVSLLVATLLMLSSKGVL